jgi:hypothetical protein
VSSDGGRERGTRGSHRPTIQLTLAPPAPFRDHAWLISIADQAIPMRQTGQMECNNVGYLGEIIVGLRVC